MQEIPFIIEDESQTSDGMLPDLPLKETAKLYRFEQDFKQRAMGLLSGEGVDARAWISAVLKVAEKQLEELPATPKYTEQRLGWANIIHYLSEIYAYYDPDLVTGPEMLAGEEVGLKLARLA
jgi:hypothetical protein